MKKLILTISILLISFNCFADKLIVPWDVYPKQMQAEFAKHDLKLDLTAVERTEDSWGFLRSEGSQYILYSYRTLTGEDLVLIMQIIKPKE